MDPLVGKVIGGRYQVVRLLAHGGMGSVYEVRHTRVNRTFALKTLAAYEYPTEGFRSKSWDEFAVPDAPQVFCD